MNATAAVLYETKKPVRIEDVELLEPGPHEVQVRWVANGVCHSDYHVINGDYPHPLPVVLGHEAAGVVERVGPGVETVAPGDHVCSSYIPSCGRCGYCIGGQPTMCALRDKPRWFMLDGTARFRKGSTSLHHFLQVAGYATHAVLPEVSVIPIRKDAPLDVVCLVSCGVLAGAGPVFNRAKVPPGASVAVFGCGGVGLSIIQGARIGGARQIIAVDMFDSKLEMALQVGATHTVNTQTGSPVQAVREFTRGAGVDHAFEAVGNAALVRQAIESLAIRGTATIVGVLPPNAVIEFPWMAIRPECKVQTSRMGSNRFRVDIPRYLELYRQGRLLLDEMVSVKGHLPDVNEAFRAMKAGEVARTVLTFD
jgi:S-(hydroxymethyl)glutathione dehydrogenase / alcohol dehydrogenase